MDSISDRLEILNKMGLYMFAWDENQPAEFYQLYTDDIVFEVWTPGKQELLLSAQGIPGNMAINQALVGSARQNGAAIRHNLSQMVFLALTENTAITKTVYTFTFFSSQGDSTPLFVISAPFNDSWVKTANGWLVNRREMVYDNLPAVVLNFLPKR